MEKLLEPAHLEELLIANWTMFINPRRMIAYVMQSVRDASLPRVKTDEVKKKGVQVTISRFEFSEAGFVVWADFSIPLNDGEVAVGTTELLFRHTGVAELTRVFGTIFFEG